MSPFTKRCIKCAEVKPEHQFGPNRKQPDGLTKWCMECMKASYEQKKAALAALGERKK